MKRLKVISTARGSEIKLSISEKIVFSEYMSDDEYNFAIKNYPNFFEKPKAKKKEINIGGYDSDK
tara:strand:+ start:2619 stop:2813 length:195 start_codon:yes stop_codon:yes gene_type:complete